MPCERVTVDVSTTLHHEPTSEQNVPSWVEPVNLAECHQRLGYSPRIFISHDNQSLYVETVERAVQRNHLKQLTDFNPDHPIQLECFMERCSSTIPMWHTTSWSKVSLYGAQLNSEVVLASGGGDFYYPFQCIKWFKCHFGDPGKTDYPLRNAATFSESKISNN